MEDEEVSPDRWLSVVLDHQRKELDRAQSDDVTDDERADAVRMADVWAGHVEQFRRELNSLQLVSAGPSQ